MKMRQRSLLRSTGIFSVITLLSRITGFIRDIIIANIFGATPSVDAFFVAFKIPNFMRELFAEGAFSQAFIPLLTSFKKHYSSAEIRLFIGRVMTLLGTATLIFIATGIIFSNQVIMVFAPGFMHDPERFQLASQFLNLTFPYLFFISLTAFSSAVLNCYGFFGIPAFTSTLLNIVLILSSIYLTQFFELPTWALAWGVFIAGIAQFLFLQPFLAKEKLFPKISFNWKDSKVLRVVKGMAPALFGVSVSQINLMIGTIFASFLVVGSVSWLYYADRVVNFPLGVVGVALSTVILPRLSQSYEDANKNNFTQSCLWSYRCILLISLPSSIGLTLLANPILITLFYHGAFTQYDIAMTRLSLVSFAIGIPAFMMIKVLASAFYAQQNIKVPVKIGVIAMISNLILNCILIKPLAHAGLALATALSAYVNVTLLWIKLKKCDIYLPQSTWKPFFQQLIISNLGLGLWIYSLLNNDKLWYSWSNTERALRLFMLIVSGILVYIIILISCGMKIKDISSPKIE